jgi:hypothetical protein
MGLYSLVELLTLDVRPTECQYHQERTMFDDTIGASQPTAVNPDLAAWLGG